MKYAFSNVIFLHDIDAGYSVFKLPVMLARYKCWMTKHA